MPYHEAAAHAATDLPVMLLGKLVGREKYLAQVYAHLKINKPVLIHGPAGIGKTALAATLASAYTELPGGALWLNAHDSPLEELVARVGRAYAVPEMMTSDTPLGMVGAAASTLTQHKPLLVLDGRLNAQAARDFISRCAPNLPALVTASEPLDGPWTPVSIPKLDEPAAVALLKQLGASGEDADLGELASILDYTPFAIAIAAGTMRLNHQTASDYLQAFESIPSSAGGDPQLLALMVGFQKLNSALQGILLMMGAIFTGGASVDLLHLVSGAPTDTLQQVMTLLANSYLVERFTRYGAPYYRLHEVTAAFAQAWLRGPGRLEPLQIKVKETALAYVRQHSAARPDAYDKLAAEMDNILAAARWSAAQGDRDTVNQIVVSLMQAGDFITERGYVYELLALRQLATSFSTAFPAYPSPPAISASGADDDEDEGLETETVSPPATLWDVAQRRTPPAPEDMLPDEDETDEDEFTEDDVDDDFDDELDDFGGDLNGEAEAAAAAAPSEIEKLQAALRLARQQNDAARQIELLTRIGEQQVAAGHDNEAITTYTDLLRVCEAEDETEGALKALDTLSALAVKTENAGAAVMHAARGIALAQKLEDADTQMHLQITLGDARQQLGESAQAIRAYEQALAIARTGGDAQNEALILYKLGAAQLDNGDPDAAASTWEQALRLFKAQGKREYEGRVLGGLGTAYGELGRWAEAINFHTSALHIAREVKDKQEEALQLGYLGYAAVAANQLGQAVLRYRQALHLAFESSDRENIVSNIVDLVRLLVESPRHLPIAELLIAEAVALEPNDRDVLRLKERIANEKMLAQASGVQMLEARGTARQYAANAYAQLES